MTMETWKIQALLAALFAGLTSVLAKGGMNTLGADLATAVRTCAVFIFIAINALLFAVIHGFPDMIALVPLALILGWIYQRTQSYIAIVTTHAAFNTFNLTMVLVQTWL